MRHFLIIASLILFGALNLSVSKSDKLHGKWKAYKMVKNGEVRRMSAKNKVPWIEFAEDNVLWTGEGENDKKRGEWWLSEDKKTIHLIIKRKDRPMTIERLSKKKLIIKFKDGRSTAKAFWKKVS